MISRFPVIIFLFFFFFFFFLCFLSVLSHAATLFSNITQGGLIKDGDTLVSDKLSFELGFFSPGNSTLRYVGIWYCKIPDPSVIWVANREKPIGDRRGSITITSDGNLVISDGDKNIVWFSNSSSIPLNGTIALLHDNGELVIANKDDPSKSYWSSFENPTDTFLPGMRVPVNENSNLGEFYAFTSWKSLTDPSKGRYSMAIDPVASIQIVVWNGNHKRWRSGYWDGSIFTGVSNMTGNYLSGFKLSDDNRGNQHLGYLPPNDTDKIRFLMTWDGYEMQFKWNEAEKQWNRLQFEPYNDCEMYNECGSFGVCDFSNMPICSCFKGFEAKNLDEWNNGNWSGGCKRKTALKAERNSSSGKDGFLERKSMKLPDFAHLTRLTSTEDCESKCLQNDSCSAYAAVNGIGCMMWYGELVDVQHFQSGGNTLYIRLADSDLNDGNGKTKIVISVVAALLIFLAISACLLWRFKGKLKVLPAVSTSSCCKNEHRPIFEPSKTTKFSPEISGPTDNMVESGQVNEHELPLFNFSCISLATNNFSEENKLGQGGFGLVYKGTLPGGEVIAVKRLSRRSGQGLEEFKNEMTVIVKLQHRNLVRLMGCSIQGDEKLLIYEYMPNRSLDCFLFDKAKQTLLDWKKRFSIIEGVARGLLYLHRDSRLRIIHRDLKASNILLDKDMNPKISDFGMARIFGGNQNEANTNRVVGTYGYMSPEYAMEGLFSVKSDVFSFGVLLLEIVSGRRNTSFRELEDSSLIGYGWHLWNEDRGMEFVDPSIRDSVSVDEALRCIHIGMLCVQDSAALRPNMSSVVLMLESEAVSIQWPRQPTLTSIRRSVDAEFHTNVLDASNNLTVTTVLGR